MVEPHCVQLPDGMPPGIPAVVQSVARVGLMIPAQGCCACAAMGQTNKSVNSNRNSVRCFILTPRGSKTEGLAPLCWRAQQSYDNLIGYQFCHDSSLFEKCRRKMFVLR